MGTHGCQRILILLIPVICTELHHVRHTVAVPTRSTSSRPDDQPDQPNPTRVAIGRVMRQARENAGLSGRELGVRLDLAPPAAQARFSRAENGLHPLAVDEFVAYAHACNTSARRLLELADVDWIDGEKTSDPVMLAISTDPSIRSDLKSVARAVIDSLRAVPAAPPRAGGSMSVDEILAGATALNPENLETLLRALQLLEIDEQVAARKRSRNGGKKS